MTASTHLAVGAVVGLSVQKFLSADASNPEKLFWAFVAGFFSHLVLDALPHQEYSFIGSKLGVILLIEIVVMHVLLLSSRSSLMVNAIIFLGMVGGALPDVIDLVYLHFLNWPWLEDLGLKIHFFHGAIPVRFKISFFIQFLVAFLAVIFVRSKPAL